MLGLIAQDASLATPVSFPGAEGYGASATGGRGGSVYHVTNLSDSGPGSFRDAVSQPNRTVVFDVGGIINFSSDVEVLDNITIAGQTAPGQGISTFGASVYLNHGFGSVTAYGHSNIIIRHMRFREGYKESNQAYSLALKPAHTVMIDHCSIEIGNWQTFSITLNTTTNEQPTDITVQNCIIGASVSNQLGVLDWAPVNLTFHHNLFVDNGGRDPKVEGNMQIINDVVYNFQLGIYGDGAEHCDLIGNYHINGPDTNASSVNQGINLNSDVTGVYYVSGNYWDNNRNGTLNGVPLVAGTSYNFNPVISATPICNPVIPVTVDTAQLAYYKVVSDAGTSLSRDVLDSVLVSQVVSLGTQGPGTGTGGVPGLYMKHVTPYTNPLSGNPIPTWSITGGTAPIDTDQDGMPDDWERATGSDVVTADNNATGTGGYTKLENYLNWMAEPHARIFKNTTLSFDLSQYTAAFNNQSPVYVLSGATNGNVTLLADGHTAQFVPTANYTGLASFNFTVTANGVSMSKTVGILISTPPANLTWKGDGSANLWNVSAANWLNSGTAAAFNYGDNVTFDDTGTGISPITVNLTTPLDPISVTFNNNAKNYVLSGTGYLFGPMALNKSGTGTLTISPTLTTLNTVTTTGSTTATVSSTIGLGAGMGVWSSASIPEMTMVVSVVDATHLVLSNAATSTGTTSATYSLANIYSGATTINSGTLTLGNANANQFGLSGGSVVFNGGTLKMYDAGSSIGAGQLSNDLVVNTMGTLYAASRCTISGGLTGSGTLNYYTPYVRANLTGDWSAFTGQISVVTDSSGGDFHIYNTYGYGTAAINLGSLAILDYSYSVPTGGLILDLGELSSSATSSKLQGGTTATNILTWRIGSRNTSATFAGSISEQNASSITALTKAGSGTWTITGSCTYKGATTVSGGVLNLAGATLSTATLLINNGCSLVTNGGAFTITGNATNNGTLRLTGTTPLSVAGTLTNNGVLDLIAGVQTLPANFVNNGTVLAASGVRVKQIAVSGSTAQLTIQSYTGHNYQLQRRDLLTSGSWQAIGSTQAGTGSVLTFNDIGGASGSQRFYRIFVSP